MPNTDVIVVGGGVIGCSIAWHLARRGVGVTVIEERGIAAAASGASAGGVRQQGRDPREMPLAIAAIARWATLADELAADLHYYREGHVTVYEDEAEQALAQSSVEAQRALGLDISLVAGQELHELVPGLGEQVLFGAYTADDGHADPARTTRAFAAAAQRDGATLMLGAAVTGLLVDGDRVTGVVTEERSMLADHVILAAGAWTRVLVSALGVDLPLEPVGLQMIRTRPMPALLRQVVGANARRLSLKQLRDGSYLIGGGWPGDPDMRAGIGYLRPESIAGSRKDSAAIFPVLHETEIDRAWVGVEAIAADEVPVIGPLPGIGRLTVAAGFSGHGFALSPIVGQLVAELVVDGRPSISLDALSSARFDAASRPEAVTPSAG